ncbi:hypothetical protein BDV34DRAFT_187516 [Aspergillus parasiticus]|uniref:Uncharacterized protein n=1 Tax=Aspergillus parasiticus TaxID=5067 RepID=A0A5N6DYB8_ASPPA|nr:hypothetical protein BDV34DRAFT_187516 [Aspergillus parasiticus]
MEPKCLPWRLTHLHKLLWNWDWMRWLHSILPMILAFLNNSVMLAHACSYHFFNIISSPLAKRG